MQQGKMREPQGFSVVRFKQKLVDLVRVQAHAMEEPTLSLSVTASPTKVVTHDWSPEALSTAAIKWSE